MALPVRVIGRNIALTCAGSRTVWQELALTFTANMANATAADSTLDESVITTMKLEGTLSGYVGTANTGATVPVVGTSVSDLAAAVGGDSAIPSISSYTNLRTTRAEFRYQSDPATWSIAFQSGVLNTAPF